MHPPMLHMHAVCVYNTRMIIIECMYMLQEYIIFPIHKYAYKWTGLQGHVINQKYSVIK